MEVNITVFVQMFNFMIAWFLLRMLYLKPAITVLDQEQHEHDAIVDKKHKWQHSVITKQQDIESRWHMLKRFSKQHRPDIAHPDFFVFKDVASQIDPEPIDKDQIKTLSQEIAQAIVTGVDHVEQ